MHVSCDLSFDKKASMLGVLTSFGTKYSRMDQVKFLRLSSTNFTQSILEYFDSFYSLVGKDAEHSANVFYHLTYEGSVDLDAVSDGITKEVTIFSAVVVFVRFQFS